MTKFVATWLTPEIVTQKLNDCFDYHYRKRTSITSKDIASCVDDAIRNYLKIIKIDEWSDDSWLPTKRDSFYFITAPNGFNRKMTKEEFTYLVCSSSEDFVVEKCFEHSVDASNIIGIDACTSYYIDNIELDNMSDFSFRLAKAIENAFDSGDIKRARELNKICMDMHQSAENSTFWFHDVEDMLSYVPELTWRR